MLNIRIFRGTGDLHDSNFDSYAVSSALGEDTTAAMSTEFTITIYPTEEYFESYTTRNPIVASIGAVCVMLLTSVLFFGYDYFVQKEFQAREIVLQAKRKFMRFISHEVRTPLNAVCIGLGLLADELMGFERKQFDAARNSSSEKQSSKKSSKPDSPNQKGASDTIRNDGSQLTQLEFQKGQLTEGHIREWMTLTAETLHNTQAAVNVLNDLLNFDKIESGDLTLDISLISMLDLVQITSHEFRLQAKQKRLQFGVDYSLLRSASDGRSSQKGKRSKIKQPLDEISEDIRHLRVAGDVVRLAQLMRNLISNAIKFTPEDGKVDIILSWQEDKRSENPLSTSSNTKSSGYSIVSSNKVSLMGSDQQGKLDWCRNQIDSDLKYVGILNIAVKDSGAGMTPEQLDSVFGEGTQFDVNRLQAGNGSGLGMFIAKGIAEQHGGTLTADSLGLDKGTCFTISIPMCNTDDLKYTRSSSASSGGVSEGVSESADSVQSLTEFDIGKMRPLRILVVDDAASNRKILCRILRNRQHVCEEATNGYEAVNRVMEVANEGWNFDCILMDSDMPEMDGPTAAQHIRNQGNPVLIIGISGNVLPEDVQYFISKGADAVLPKPLNIIDLQNMLRARLQRKKREKKTDAESTRKVNNQSVKEKSNVMPSKSNDLIRKEIVMVTELEKCATDVENQAAFSAFGTATNNGKEEKDEDKVRMYSSSALSASSSLQNIEYKNDSDSEANQLAPIDAATRELDMSSGSGSSDKSLSRRSHVKLKPMPKPQTKSSTVQQPVASVFLVNQPLSRYEMDAHDDEKLNILDVSKA